MNISETEIYAYREVYYEHLKPLLMADVDSKMIDIMMEGIYEEYGLTKDRFEQLQTIDFIQRLKNINDKRITVKVGDTEISKQSITNSLNFPELRCPRRSEQQ